MVEANYEFEHIAADAGTPSILRRQEYWTLLSGAAGQLYGNRYTWPFIERLAEPPRHARVAPDGLREVPVRAAAAGTTWSRTRTTPS